MTGEAVVLEENYFEAESKVRKHWLYPGEFLQLVRLIRRANLWSRPWLGWAFVYVVLLLFFFVYRCVALTALITMYGTNNDCTAGVEAGALGLGLLEDFVCATYLAFALWLVDSLCRVLSDAVAVVHIDIDAPTKSEKRRRLVVVIIRCTVTFATSWLLFVATVTPFVADLLLVRLRDMRFTFELVAMAIHEKDNAGAAAISESEMKEAYVTVAVVVIVATFFAVVRTWASWAELTRWNPTHPVVYLIGSRCCWRMNQMRQDTVKSMLSLDEDDDDDDAKVTTLELGAATEYSGTLTPKNASYSDATTDGELAPPSSGGSSDKRLVLYRCGIQTIAVLVALLFVPMLVQAISCACSPLVAYTALNATLNELFLRALHVTSQGFAPVIADGTIPLAKTYIHSATEDYTLFEDDSLYRRTTGFHGDLAFNVSVSADNPPNVLLIVVESFRYHDSRYLVGDEDPSNLFKGSNLTVTPNFDKWAKRGVAFRNMWSSWRTSRSVESLQFAQLPYDSAVNSGMTGGQEDVELAGLPQLFKAKGYEPFFTTGCKTDYDDWNKFLPSHGFETVWSRDEMMELAQSDLGIEPDQWYGADHRGFNWGVHDDLSFQLLGDLLLNKTNAQSERIAQGEAKTPLFLTHYTISSHVPYYERPAWYAEVEKPDFSALYNGEEYADNIKNYLEMRYFTDMELGKFMDRMADEGVLNDTVVVIVGDHGQAPEFGNDVPEARDASVTRVAAAIIAEGRLGDAVGLQIEDAAEQYDMLNTLADITGVPDGGFLQDGVGRSLKRNVTFGERVVFSNNPNRKMSVVRGHERLRYDHYSSSVLLHDADTDHDMHTDLFPALSGQEQADWLLWRGNGRRLNAYYTKRWDNKCLLATEC